MGGPNSLFAGLGTPPGFPGISPLGVTPPDPLRKSNSSSSLSSPLLVPPPASSGSNPGPKVLNFLFFIIQIKYHPHSLKFIHP